VGNEEELGALVGKRFGHPAADAGAGSGDDGDLAFQASHGEDLLIRNRDHLARRLIGVGRGESSLLIERVKVRELLPIELEP
jgi:hypothetical protein